MRFKQLTVFFIVLLGTYCHNEAYSQLWAYIGDTPAKDRAFEKRLQKEAYSVITHYDADRFPYKELRYHLQSLDGPICNVHIMQVPFTKMLNISTLRDSLMIPGCTGTDQIHFLSKELLEIVYGEVGGSDDGYENVLLLALKNGKFRIAMEIQSLHQYDTPDDVGVNEVHLKLNGQTRKEYQLILKTHDLYRSQNKSKNFDHYHTYTLKYDDTLNLFYMSYETISGLIWDDTNNHKQKIKGIFPEIKIGDEEYCYVNNYWHSVGKDGKGNINMTTDYFIPKAKN